MRHLSATGLALLLAAGAGRADQVVMDNGDRYGGRVTGMSNGVLQLQGEFGDLQLPWARIETLDVDQPMEMVLTSGTRLHGRLAVRDGMARFLERELAGLALPQTDIISVRPADSTDLRTEGRVNVGAATARGNTHSDSYHADGEFIARTSRNRFRLSGQLNYAEKDRQRVANDASAAFSYDHFLGGRWYFNSTAGLARDEFKNLDLRSTIGAGVGYQFRDQGANRLAIELGLSYVHEDFDSAEDQAQPAGRYALNVQHRLALGPTLFHRHEVLFGLEHTGDVLLHTETGIRFPLLRHITGTVQVNGDYDWEPAPGARPEDIAYQITFGYEFLP